MAIRFLKLDSKPSKRQIAKYSELVHRSVDFIPELSNTQKFKTGS